MTNPGNNHALISQAKKVVKKSPPIHLAMAKSKRIAYTIVGFLKFHCWKRKSIVLVFSSMRTGSTLLKSLVGEAQDVSLIDEFNFLSYVNGNKYLFYGIISSLAPEKIIVLKKPYNNNTDDLENYGLSPLADIRKIILYRDPFDTLCSLEKLQIRRKKRIFSNEELVNYWCDSYESLLKNTASDKVLVVKYEDLTEHPKRITGEIFSFVGSQMVEGVERYGEYQWVGGRDDISDKIKSLTVSEARKNEPSENPGLHALVSSDKRLKSLLIQLENRNSLQFNEQ